MINNIGIGIPFALKVIGGAIAALFAKGEQGVWYDPSDISLNWRRNLLTYTEQFDNATAWAASSGITANATIAPDGTTTADLINVALAVPYQAITCTPNTTYTYSLDVRLNTLLASDFTFAVRNDTAGTFIAADIVPSQTLSSTNWVRITYTFTTPAGCVLVRPYIYRNSSAKTGTFYAWGAQLEVGSTATAYQRIVTPEISYLDVQPQPILYQDSAGTTPVTAVEQPVGLMLDKSKGLVLGSELVVNGDFSSASGWGLAGGVWSISGGVASTIAGSTGGLTQNISITAGRFYLVTLNISGWSANGVIAQFTGGTTASGGLSSLANGQYRTIILANSGNTTLSITKNSSATALSVDNISVKEITGNHAFQATSASRPTLSARYNLLTYSEQFDNAAWQKTNITVTANAIAAPDGTLSADKIEATTSATTTMVFPIIVQATQLIFTCYVKKGSGATDANRFNLRNGTTATNLQQFTINYDTGVITAIVGSGVTATDVGNGWWKITAPLTSGITAGNSLSLNLLFQGSSETAGEFSYIWGADLRVTNDALNQPSYQRIAAATDYDTVGFKPYLRFDGSDDSLATNSIDFTATDKCTIGAGVRKLSDAAVGMLLELSANLSSNTGAFHLYPITSTYLLVSKGTIASTKTSPADYAPPITNVVTGIGNISGDIVGMRINQTALSNVTTDQGTGNYGNYPLYIGRRGGSALPFNGRLYQLIVRGAQSTDAEISNMEQFINLKTGAF